jgi:hypothetical protein
MGFFSLSVIKIPQFYVLSMFLFFLSFGHRKRTEMDYHASMAISLKHLFPFFYIHYKMKNLYVHHGLHRCHPSCCICNFRIADNILHRIQHWGENYSCHNEAALGNPTFLRIYSPITTCQLDHSRV